MRQLNLHSLLSLVSAIIYVFLCVFESVKITTANDVANCIANPRDQSPVQRAVKQAQSFLQQNPSPVPIADRIAVMILFSRGLQKNGQSSSRVEYLRCALLKLQNHLMVNSTADVYIWTLNSTDNPVVRPSWLTEKDFPRVHLIELPEDAWRIPCDLIPSDQWAARKHFDIDYYLMGRWRLTFSFDFAKAMGYEFHLQYDDDAMLNSPIPYNITAKFNENNAKIGFFSDIIGEVPHLVLGLPEITQYWLRINRYQPKGSIFQHLKKHSLGENIQAISSDTWDRLYHPGYFILIRVSFWYTPEVQDYLRTIMKLGRDVEGRWQEQAVMNMISLIFLPEKEVWVMQEVDIGHDRHKRANFENWCVKTGLIQH